jgi:hypothetical protein
MNQKEVEELLKSNNGSDIIDSEEEIKEISIKELYENLNTVEEKWYQVEKIPYIIPRGKPPSNISSQLWNEIVQRCTLFDKVVEYKIPIIWLLLEMRRMKIDQIFINSTILSLTRIDNNNNSNAEENWIKVVTKYNGLVKILKELNKFCKDEDGQPTEICYNFYREKETTTDDVDDSFVENSAFDNQDIVDDDIEEEFLNNY